MNEEEKDFAHFEVSIKFVALIILGSLHSWSGGLAFIEIQDVLWINVDSIICGAYVTRVLVKLKKGRTKYNDSIKFNLTFYSNWCVSNNIM